MHIITFQTLCLIAVTSTALLAGVYFIFHNTIMVVLVEQDGIQVMNRINQVILNKTFLIIFILSPLSSILLIALGLSEGQLNFQTPVIYGALLSILAFLITIRFNVPLNNKLALAVESDPNIWEHYLEHWANWNRRRYYISTLSVAVIAAGLLF